MDAEKKALEQIFEKLKSKACLKQEVYRTTIDVFQEIKNQANQISLELNQRIQPLDNSVEVILTDSHDFEFQLKVGSDMLIFTMATNVVTFAEDYAVMASDYIKNDPERKYFGQIMVYNFMADTIKYNRLEDPGYLIARFIVNRERHFYVEGVQQLNFLFTDIVNNKISSDWLRLFVEKCILTSIDMDLVGSNYPNIQNTTLLRKTKSEKHMGNGRKLGFQLEYMSDIDS